MQKLLLVLVPCLLLIGGGCLSEKSSSAPQTNFNTPSSAVTSTDVPQGNQTVYACNLNTEYCVNIDAYLDGDQVTSAFDTVTNDYIATYNSFCDNQGCFFYDQNNDEWYFNFK